MPRLIYASIFALLLPFIFLKYLIRSRHNPEYRQNLLERISARLPRFKQGKVIHIHLVSVGEANAASTLINKLLEAYPNANYLITITTPTGRSRVKTLFGHIPQVTIRYLPFDVALFMERFIRLVKPSVSIILETELWPYFLLFARRYHLPVVLINARLSKKSLKGYLRMPKTSREMITSLDLVLAQYKPDKKRLLKLGCNEDTVAAIGNIKFDLTLPEDQLQKGYELKRQQQRPIWIAASTHEGEESSILIAHQRLLETYPDALLILVPRHLERFAEVTSLAKERFKSVTRSSGQQIVSDTQVFIGDTIGEMFFYLALADLTFIGGSLEKCGGHNPIEPAAIGLPIVTGPHVFNFKSVFKQCVKKRFCIQIEDKKQLPETLLLLFNDDQLRQTMAQNAKKFVNKNQGVTDKMLKHLAPYL